MIAEQSAPAHSVGLGLGLGQEAPDEEAQMGSKSRPAADHCLPLAKMHWKRQRQNEAL